MKYTFMLMLCFSFFSLTQAQQHTIQAADTQPGTLDQSYGNNGLVYNIAPQSLTECSAIQADNKIMLAVLSMLLVIYTDYFAIMWTARWTPALVIKVQLI